MGVSLKIDVIPRTISSSKLTILTVTSFFWDLLIPPKRVALDWKCCDGIKLHTIGVFGFCVRQTLPERQNIWLHFGLRQLVNQSFGILDILVPFLLETGDPQSFPFDQDPLAIDCHNCINPLHYKLTLSALNQTTWRTGEGSTCAI